MKIYVVSDIHGSYYYTKKFIEQFTQGKGDKIVILGDILYHGPRNPLPREYDPKAVYELLNKYKNQITWIKGNCDSEVDEMVLEFRAYNSKTIKCGKYNFICVHGHKLTEESYNLRPGNILLHGHTHISFIESINGIIVANPGSISIPKEGLPNSYMVITENEIKIFDLSLNTIKELNI